MSPEAKTSSLRDQIFQPPDEIAKQAHVTAAQYEHLYQRSIQDPEGFWAEMAHRIHWFKKPSIIKDCSFGVDDLHIKWYEDGVLNACHNCIDRHLPQRTQQTAIIWESDDPGCHKRITYAELKSEVCRLANALKARGVKKGDRVTIYMPMVPEAIFAMLACARIGAIHSVVFAGFSPDSLRGRILDCESTVLVTADESVRGGRRVPLKRNADEALEACPLVHTVLVLRHTGSEIGWNSERDVYWHELIAKQSDECACEEMGAEDPLFILYTSGSTGTPKGVLHTTGGYLVYASLTHEWVFDYKEGEVYWCTADIGWITGHTYLVYGPLANGATTLVFAGVPNYPDHSRYWQVIDKHKVNIFYTAPTAIRSLMREGLDPVKKSSRKSLRILGSVGEPINPEAWLWYYNVIGEGRCPIVDTWWQTETGGIVITPLPGAIPTKPGSAAKPFFGVKPVIVDDDGNELQGACEGALCIADSWPGQMRTVYRNHARFVKTYFTKVKGMYFTDDGCRRDEDGYYWITGRIDDVIKVSGHRLGTAAIESAINTHHAVAESAVVGSPHEIKGQGIHAFVILKSGVDPGDEIRKEIVQKVRAIIGPFATPDEITFVPALPKTNSGKIMRRILRKIAGNEFDNLGDTSTLADSTVVEKLIKSRKRV
jgi:acetyl-CoA synthetase